MITRIRYKTEKGIMTSVTPLLAKTTMLIVTINLPDMAYTIINDQNQEVGFGYSNSKQKILNEVKTKVKELGVLFHDEIRPRKTKVSKKISDKMLGEEDESVSDYRID